MIRPGATGLLAEPFDTHEFAAAVRTVLEDDDLRGRMSAECRRVAEAEFPSTRQAEQYLNLYRNTLGQPAENPAGVSEPAAARELAGV